MKGYYEPEFVEKLFDDMSSSYARMNYITSFGFSERWRRQCVKGIDIQENYVVVDLMTGMGECWKHILGHSNKNPTLIALDFSTEMIKYAALRKRKFKHHNIDILKENVFSNSIKSESADCIISGFGLKTFDEEQLERLAKEMDRILKVGGKFSMMDVSVPPNKILKFFYLFYLKKIIPVLGKLFLGNPETYSMLGIYTEAFVNSRKVEAIFKKHGFEVQYREYFFGCASGITGVKQ